MKTFEIRKEQHWEQLEVAYKQLYGGHSDVEANLQQLQRRLQQCYQERPQRLKEQDQTLAADWYLGQDMVGVMVYIDHFADDFTTFMQRLDYFSDLGIRYLHFMPCLKPRAGENDGGYAVEDFLDTDPRLGTKQQLECLIEACSDRGISVCIDYVMNHVAKEHTWAKQAVANDPTYQEYFILENDLKIIESYNATVPWVLPDKAPGNFTYNEELQTYVYTSFSSFQWDLNYRNPIVLEEMLATMFAIAAMGVQIIRLDAVPFLWKQLGTNCRNLPEVHIILRLFRLASQIVAPSLVLLGEAIVEEPQIRKYFGSATQPECHLMYHASFMVTIFNALATRRAKLLEFNQERNHNNRGWMNYIRCHDDIGWGFDDEDCYRLGWQPETHKQYLIRFYNGTHPGSFARGENYQYNPITQDARTNGTLASLLGLSASKALHDQRGITLSMERMQLILSLLFSAQGIVLLYSGDELSQENDQSYLNDPKKQREGRWVHRPAFPWGVWNQLEQHPQAKQMYEMTKQMIELRRTMPLFHGKYAQQLVHHPYESLYIIKREEENRVLVCIHNVSEHPQDAQVQQLGLNANGSWKDMLSSRNVDCQQAWITIHPYESLWLLNEK
ncbi:MAG: alpha-amylase family glycosyl hydrolase [Erysipelotrichaceae bacterium]